MENQHAPDYFNITVDGAPLLFHAFAHRVLPIGPLGQTLPTANLVAWGRLGFEEQGRAANHDAIYDYRGSFALSSLPRTASSVTITCFASGAGWQGWNDPDRGQDEAFGVDHITVTTNSPNLPPACTDAAAGPNALWPANHEMVAIAIGVVTDPDGDPIHITVNSVFQDESANVTDYGDTAPDAPRNPLYVRAERAKTGNARAYHINFTAADDNGGTCTGSVMVGVPQDKGKQNAVVDGGSLLDSTRLQVQTDIISPNMTGESQGLGRALLPRVSGCRIVRRRLRPVAREGERVAERRAVTRHAWPDIAQRVGIKLGIRRRAPLRTAADSKLVGDDVGQRETVLGAFRAGLEVEDRLVAGPSFARGLHAEQPECANPDAVSDRGGAIYTNLSGALAMGRRSAEPAPNRR